MKKSLFFCLFIVLVCKLAMLNSGCANIIPPEGGPRDSTAPKLVRVSPPDSTRNFSGTRINFTFDEFVEVENARENVFISPSPLREPKVDNRLNTVTLKLNEQLEPNTTYVINFGNAIRDYNEANIYKNFTYTFSTGPYIDSLELSGNVILAENGKIDTTMIVMLHTLPDDSAVVNERPRYYTKLDSKGAFVFRNLPPKTFYLYALKDLNGTRRYIAQNLASLFAFADKPIKMSGTTAPVTLYAYSPKPISTTVIPSTGIGPLNNRLGNKNLGADRLKYQSNLSGNQQELINNLILTFDKPLRKFDTSRIKLFSDSTYANVNNYRVTKDSTNKKVVVTHSWKENTIYHLVIDKDFAEDSTGKKLLKTDTLSFKSKKIADYGSLVIKLKNLDLTKHPVLLLMLGETIFRSTPLKTNEFSLPQIGPGEYELRILFDENNNGTWDPGEFFGKHKQPELVKPIERKLNVKANWQNEFDIQL